MRWWLTGLYQSKWNVLSIIIQSKYQCCTIIKRKVTFKLNIGILEPVKIRIFNLIVHHPQEILDVIWTFQKIKIPWTLKSISKSMKFGNYMLQVLTILRHLAANKNVIFQSFFLFGPNQTNAERKCKCLESQTPFILILQC